MNESQLTIGQLLAALSRNKKKCALVFLITMCSIVAYWQVAPKKFGSEGRVFVQIGRANTAIEYSKGAMPISIQNARETEIRSVMELIKSHDVISQAVLDPEVTTEAVLQSPFDFITESIKLPKFLSSSDSTQESELTPAQRTQAIDLQKAVKKISKNLKVSMEKNTSVISIYVSAQDPHLAKKIVDKIMHYTAEVHVKVHQRAGTADFFKLEFDNQKEKVKKAEVALKNYRNGVRTVQEGDRLVERKIGKPFLSISGARNTMQLIVDKIENELIDVELNHRQAKVQLVKLMDELEITGKLVDVPTKGVERLSTESAREEIFRLKSERAELISKYKSHPRVDIINNRLAEMEKDFESLQEDRTEMMSASNPAYEEIAVAKSLAAANVDALEARLNLTKTKHEKAIRELSELNQTEIVAEELKRELSIEHRYLETYIEKYGDLSVINRLDEKMVSDIVVQQVGTLLLKHASPKGSILLPLGMVLATMLSVLTALVFDRSKLSSTDEEEVEEVLDIPVLITLPRVANRRAMVR
ncbi:hypothetical protein OAG68_00555 [bacterium]|nr:hypothetical protein [bacterium]